MSVTTAAVMNPDQLQSALTALVPGSGFICVGDLTQAGSKVITGMNGATDANVTAAVATASAAFVNYATNAQTIATNVANNLAQVEAWIAANPAGAVLTAAQTLFLAKTLVGLARILLAEFSSTAGT